jgi:transcription-repair coupling factor (superfamily II helicase)
MRLELPTIAAGKRFTLRRPAGSGDALLLARLGQALHTPV